MFPIRSEQRHQWCPNKCTESVASTFRLIKHLIAAWNDNNFSCVSFITIKKSAEHDKIEIHRLWLESNRQHFRFYFYPCFSGLFFVYDRSGMPRHYWALLNYIRFDEFCFENNPWSYKNCINANNQRKSSYCCCCNHTDSKLKKIQIFLIQYKLYYIR